VRISSLLLDHRGSNGTALQKSKSNADLADAIRRGGAGVGLTSLMRPWGHTIDERHINAVVLYIRSLRRQTRASGSAGLYFERAACEVYRLSMKSSSRCFARSISLLTWSS
jgi:hypothetical protein